MLGKGDSVSKYPQKKFNEDYDDNPGDNKKSTVEGSQSLIKLNPKRFNENDTNNQQDLFAEKNNEELTKRSVEKESERDRDREHAERFPPIKQNTTIKNIIGNQPKKIKEQNLNDQIDPDNLEMINDDEDSNSNRGKQTKQNNNEINKNKASNLVPLMEEENDYGKDMEPLAYQDNLEIDNDDNNNNEEEEQAEEQREIAEPDNYNYINADPSDKQSSNKNNKIQIQLDRKNNNNHNQEQEEPEPEEFRASEDELTYEQKRAIELNNKSNNIFQTSTNKQNEISPNDNLTILQNNKKQQINSKQKQKYNNYSNKPFQIEAVFNKNKLTLHKKKNPQVPLSKIQLAENNYIIIKDELITLFTILDSIEDDSTIDYNYNIELMLSYLDQLNSILNSIVQAQKTTKIVKVRVKNLNTKPLPSAYSQMQLDQIEASNAKLLDVYRKQYLSMKTRYTQITDNNYITSLQSENKELDEKIFSLEQQNRQLKTHQARSENLFIKKINDDTLNTQLKKLVLESEKYQCEYEKVVKRIDANILIIKDNDSKIEQLAERERTLRKTAKDLYKMEDFDNVKLLEKKDKEKEDAIQKYKKQIEVLDKAYKSSQLRFTKEMNDNNKHITQLEEDRRELMEVLRMKMNPSDTTINLDTNEDKPIGTRMHNANSQMLMENDSCQYQGSNSSLYTKGGKDRYSINKTVPTNQSMNVKEMVLKELEKKQKADELLHNMSLDNPKLDTSIVLKKIALKPNFSFNKKVISESNAKKEKELADLRKIGLGAEVKEEIKIDEEITDDGKITSIMNHNPNQIPVGSIIGREEEDIVKTNPNDNINDDDNLEKRRSDERRKQMLNTPLMEEIGDEPKKERYDNGIDQPPIFEEDMNRDNQFKYQDPLGDQFNDDDDLI